MRQKEQGKMNEIYQNTNNKEIFFFQILKLSLTISLKLVDNARVSVQKLAKIIFRLLKHFTVKFILTSLVPCLNCSSALNSVGDSLYRN